MEGKSTEENTKYCVQLNNPRVLASVLLVCLFFLPTCFECFCIPMPHLSQEKSKAGHIIGRRLSQCKFELDSNEIIL